MASLPTRTTASFAAIAPVPNLTVLDNEFNQYVGASGIFNGGTTATKLLIKASDASDPPVEIDQIGAGPLAEWKQNGSLKASIENDGDLLTNGITTAAGVVTFGSIPLGPASNPTTDNQLARKAYVDTKEVSFSACFAIPDPSSAATNSSDFGALVIPVGGTYELTQVSILFINGSHTSGGSLTVGLFKAGTGNLANLTLDNTNNTINTLYTTAFGANTQAAGSIISPFISARSGTISERNVIIALEGTRTVI